MNLVKLAVENFKGITAFEFEAGGADVTVYGQNASGKTTLFDAYLWTLFGKDSQNSASFEVKTIGPDGEPLHGLEHSVEIALDVDGETLTLRRTLREKWVRKRGSAAREFAGHETEYAVDGVPMSKSEFDGRVAALVDEKMFRLLSDPLHFNTALHWQERRKILMGLAETPSPAEVLQDGDLLADFERVVGKRTPTEARRVLEARRKDLRKDLDAYAPRIAEARRSATGNADVRAAEKRLEAVQNRILKERAAVEQANREYEELRAEWRALKDAEAQREREHAKHAANISAALHSAKSVLDRAQHDVERRKEALQEARAKYKRDAAQKDSCPTCGSPIDSKQHAAHLKALIEDGQSCADRLAEAEARAKEAAPAVEHYERLLAEHGDFEPDPRLAELEARIDDAPQPAEVDASGLLEAQATVVAARSAAKAKERVTELEAEERECAQAYEQAEADLFVLEEYNRLWVTKIESSINAEFEIVDFKLFAEQINGGTTEVCVATVNGVPYDNLNQAARVQAGLDIIRTLQRFMGIGVPVWIDGRESVTEIPDMDCQVISLVVSPEDAELRLEVAA